MMYQFRVRDSSDTHSVAGWLYRSIQQEASQNAAGQKVATQSVLIGLYGALGAGKTEFVRGFADRSGYEGDVTSPTYVLESIYELANGRAICHWDLYRLPPTETEIALFEERNDPRNILIVEWPERIPRLAGLLDIKITLSYPEQATDSQSLERLIEIQPFGIWVDILAQSHPDSLAVMGIVSE